MANGSRRWRNLSLRRRYFLSAFAGQVIVSAVGFGGAVASARLLGPSGKGELTAWTLVATVGGPILAASVATGMGRRALAADVSTVVWNAAAHAACVMAVALVGFPIATLAGLDSLGYAVFVLVALPLGVFSEDLLTVLQALKRPWLYQSARILNMLVFSVGAVFLLASGSNDAKEALWILFGAGSIASAVLLAVAVSRLFAQSKSTQLRQISGLGRGSTVGTLADWVLFRADQAMVIGLAGSSALGQYGVAVNWAEIPQYAGHSIGQSLFEDESTLHPDQARAMMRRIACLMAGMGVVVAAAGFLLIPVVFGEEFADARWLMLLLVPGTIGRTIAYSYRTIMFASGGAQRFAVATSWAAMLGFLGWIVGGAVGAGTGIAVGSSLAYWLQAGLVSRAYRHLNEPAGSWTN